MLSSPVYPSPEHRRPFLPFVVKVAFLSPSVEFHPRSPGGHSYPLGIFRSKPLLSCQQIVPVNPLPATLMDLPASVANKRLTSELNPLDATLTKNMGWLPIRRPTFAEAKASPGHSSSTGSHVFHTRPSTSVPRRIESILCLESYCSLGPTRIHSVFD